MEDFLLDVRYFNILLPVRFAKYVPSLNYHWVQHASRDTYNSKGFRVSVLHLGRKETRVPIQ